MMDKGGPLPNDWELHAPTDGSHSVRVLVADDENTHLFLLELFLKKWGYEVVSVDNGTDALRALENENRPCVVILDWLMPGLTGLEVAEELRKDSGKANLYLLMLTSKAQQSDRTRAFAAGVDDYMTKPFDPEELRQRLIAGQRLIESRRQ